MNTQRGSAMIYILIAVVLFAGLSFTMMRSERTGQQSIDPERARLMTSEFLSYMNAIEGAASNIVVYGGFDEDQVSFENADEDFENTECTSNRCRVFHPSGGAMNYPDLLALGVLDEARSEEDDYGQTIFLYEDDDVSVEGVGTEDPEILIQVNNLNRSICTAINEALKIENDGDDAPEDATDIIGETADVFAGRKNGCRKLAAGSYQYFHVIFAR